MPIHIDRLREK